jgi:hypothetical protein
VISFTAFRNGQRLSTGAVHEGVLTAMLTWVTAKPGGRAQELSFDLSGLECGGAAEEHLYWSELSDLGPGDELLIRIERGAAVDPPARREPGREKREQGWAPTVVCSFCKRPRPPMSMTHAAEATMCRRCEGLAGALLEQSTESVLHLRKRSHVACSLCLRLDCKVAVGTDDYAACSSCLVSALE